MKTKNRMETVLDSGYEFHPSKYFSKAWDTFKDYPGHYIGFTILIFMLSMIVGLIPFVSQFYSISVGASLGLGFAVFTFMVNTQKDERFERFFGGLKFILPITVVGILQTLLFLLVASPLIYMFKDVVVELMEDSSPEAIIEVMGNFSGNGLLISMIGLLIMFLWISLRWAPLLIIFHDYSPIEALKTSWILVNKNIGGHLIFLLLMILVSILGVLAFFVGLLAAIPVIQISEYYGFSEVTGLESDKGHELDQIGLSDEDLI